MPSVRKNVINLVAMLLIVLSIVTYAYAKSSACAYFFYKNYNNAERPDRKAQNSLLFCENIASVRAFGSYVRIAPLKFEKFSLCIWVHNYLAGLLAPEFSREVILILTNIAHKLLNVNTS